MYTDFSYMQKIRHELHQCPELGFDLPETTAIVRRELDALQIPYTTKYAPCSIVGTIGPENAKKTIGIRVDMDALPVTEENHLFYASLHPGKMHACGHDMHTAILLGAAKELKRREAELKCRVLLLFQPAEETTEGARRMCQNGVMSGVTELLGVHQNMSFLPKEIALNKQVMSAACKTFEIKLTGKSAHAAEPEYSIDAIAMAVRVYEAVQFLRSRELNPFEAAVIHIGAIHGGDVENVVCNEVTLKGTVRTILPGLQERIVDRMNRIVAHIAMDMGGKGEIVWSEGVPVGVNHPDVHDKLVAAAEKIVGKENIKFRKPGMGAEDFAVYGEYTNAARFFIGAYQPDCGDDHNSNFNASEDGMANAADIFVQYILDNQE